MNASIYTTQISLNKSLPKLILKIYTQNDSFQIPIQNYFLQKNTFSFSKTLELEQDQNKIWVFILENSLIISVGQDLKNDLKLKFKNQSFRSSYKISFFGIGLVYSMFSSIIDQSLKSHLQQTHSINYSFNQKLLPGDLCGQTPRQAKIDYICGSSTNLRQVDEYSLCKYRAVIQSPLLCGQEYTDQASFTTPQFKAKKKSEQTPIKSKRRKKKNKKKINK